MDFIESEKAIQRTDDDALDARISAANLGYLEDPFGQYFARTKRAVSRKSPIINRGTYVRTKAIDYLIGRFLESYTDEQLCQIVSLGAGSDTRFFNLKVRYKTKNIRYHEIDFADVTRRKVYTIRQTPGLMSIFDTPPEINVKPGTLMSQSLNIHPFDLRDFTSETKFPNLDINLPTIVLSECCLIYLEPESADRVFTWITSRFQEADLGIVLYEPIEGNDSFGKMMIRNLAARGIILKTLQKYATLEAQRKRIESFGIPDAMAVNVNFALERWIGEKEIQRISKLEMLDELEEWTLISNHYCIAAGWRGGQQTRDGPWIEVVRP